MSPVLFTPDLLPDLHTSAGSPEERGYALGRHAAESLFRHLELWLRPAKERGAHRSDAVRDMRAAAELRFPHLMRELEGIAKGAEASVDDIFLLNCLADLPGDHPSAVAGCTTLLLPVDREGLAYVIAHNEDGSARWPISWFMARVVGAPGVSYAAFCYAGKLPGTAFSVTGNGLVQTINDIRTLTNGTGVPRGFLARAILDCASLVEALALLREHPRASGYHHSLGQSGEPGPISVEAPSGAVVASASPQAMAHANHLISEHLRGVAQRPPRGSLERQAHAERIIRGLNRSPLEALRDADEAGVSLVQRPVEDNDWYQTLASVAFDINSQGVLWSATADARRWTGSAGGGQVSMNAVSGL